MSDWILYDDLVDLIREHHHDAYSGLITGLSDQKHSFQIGFNRGEIIILTYRIKKGLAALPLIAQIERAKITDHPTTDIADAVTEVIDTSMVLSRLTANTLDETSVTITGINQAPDPAAKPGQAASSTIDERMRQKIEAAAVHHFGPIGAMVCEEHLATPGSDLRTVLTHIAEDVGASETDTQAFFEDVSKR